MWRTIGREMFGERWPEQETEPPKRVFVSLFATHPAGSDELHSALVCGTPPSIQQQEQPQPTTINHDDAQPPQSVTFPDEPISSSTQPASSSSGTSESNAPTQTHLIFSHEPQLPATTTTLSPRNSHDTSLHTDHTQTSTSNNGTPLLENTQEDTHSQSCNTDSSSENSSPVKLEASLASDSIKACPPLDASSDASSINSTVNETVTSCSKEIEPVSSSPATENLNTTIPVNSVVSVTAVVVTSNLEPIAAEAIVTEPECTNAPDPLSHVESQSQSQPASDNATKFPFSNAIPIIATQNSEASASKKEKRASGSMFMSTSPTATGTPAPSTLSAYVFLVITSNMSRHRKSSKTDSDVLLLVTKDIPPLWRNDGDSLLQRVQTQKSSPRPAQTVDEEDLTLEEYLEKKKAVSC